MARKKRVSFGERLGHAVSDIANAASVAATGSEIRILELAAEEEMGAPAGQRRSKVRAVRKKRKAKAVAKKNLKKKTGKKTKRKVAPKKAKRPKRKKRAAS